MSLERRTPIRTRSPRRVRVMVQRRKLVAELLEAFPYCLAKLPGCDGRSVDVHELLSRGRGGSILDVDNCLAVCRRCHDYITRHPTEAEALGLALSSPPAGQSCRLVTMPDGEVIRVYAGGELTEEALEAFAELVAAARRRFTAEGQAQP